MIWETGGDIGSYRRKLKIEKDGYDSLSIEHKGEIQVIFHTTMDLLISSIPNILFMYRILMFAHLSVPKFLIILVLLHSYLSTHCKLLIPFLLISPYILNNDNVNSVICRKGKVLTMALSMTIAVSIYFVASLTSLLYLAYSSLFLRFLLPSFTSLRTRAPFLSVHLYFGPIFTLRRYLAPEVLAPDASDMPEICFCLL